MSPILWSKLSTGNVTRSNDESLKHMRSISTTDFGTTIDRMLQAIKASSAKSAIAHAGLNVTYYNLVNKVKGSSL